MEHIRYEQDGPLASIILARGKANALTGPMLAEILEAVEQAQADPAVGALVLGSATPRFFSAGFDVTQVFRFSREELEPFLRRFATLVDRLLHFPKPTVAALSGHTYAGGAILSLTCDFRVMAAGDYGFALSEINIGVGLPPSIFRMLADAAGVTNARRMFLTGDAVKSARALEIGLVDELASEGDVLEHARALGRTLAAKPPAAYAKIKQVLRASQGHERRPDGQAFTIDVDTWFSDEAMESKRRILQSLGK